MEASARQGVEFPADEARPAHRRFNHEQLEKRFVRWGFKRTYRTVRTLVLLLGGVILLVFVWTMVVYGLPAAIEAYRAQYAQYYQRCQHSHSPAMRDPNAIVYLIPAVGMIAFAADNPGKWLIECAAIGHPEIVRSGWFEVA